MSLSGTSLSRGGWALTAVASLSVWLIAPHASAEIEVVSGSDFPRALLGLASLVQLALGTWVIVVVGLAQLFGSTAVLRAVAPRMLRGALFASAAGVLAITPAQADRGSTPPRDHAAVSVPSHDLAGLPFPDRPQTQRPRHPLAALPDRQEQVVIVQAGDTLWAIARRSLPSGSPEADIARSCHAWFAANRAVIGADPDLILPGQQLHPPTKEHS
jgi:nucleoid-associated protein YgaU